VEIAGLAAERRSDDDLIFMETILFTAAQRIDDPLTFIESDVEFHASLARATQNELFSMLLASISNVMTEVRVIGLAVPGTPERALRYHRDVYRAVVTQDREAARQAMDRHMDEAIQTMTRSLAQMNAAT
jgi:GntR family transcriptional repressor for pyruvate dehydrogenase complex